MGPTVFRHPVPANYTPPSDSMVLGLGSGTVPRLALSSCNPRAVNPHWDATLRVWIQGGRFYGAAAKCGKPGAGGLEVAVRHAGHESVARLRRPRNACRFD